MALRCGGRNEVSPKVVVKTVSARFQSTAGDEVEAAEALDEEEEAAEEDEVDTSLIFFFCGPSAFLPSSLAGTWLALALLIRPETNHKKVVEQKRTSNYASRTCTDHRV
jgi:hypothetical protein